MLVYTVMARNGRDVLMADTGRETMIHRVQIHANADLLTYPGYATPHYVIQVWAGGVTDWRNDIHIYGR